GLFGESDDEKAARLAREQKEVDQDAAIANLKDQVSALEDSVRRLTGQNETLSHRVDELNTRIERMQKDFDYKLCTVTAQQVGGDSGSLPCDSSDNSGASVNSGFVAPPSAQMSANAPSTGAPLKLSPPSGVLGTLPRDASAGAAASAPASAGAPSTTS